MLRQLHEIDTYDMVANADQLEVLDHQPDGHVVVMRSHNGSKVVIHDQPNGATTVTVEPDGGQRYFMYLPPEMPFTTFIKLMEIL